MALTKTPIELSSTPGIVDNSNDTAITIDASENVLVGKTSAGGVATVGAEFRGSDGYVISTASSDKSGWFGRNTSDGAIVGFYKDGTDVGSIGSIGGQYLNIGTGDAGFAFDDDTNTIVPWNPAANANTDATLSLGSGSQRFKDIYLSGGVVFGDAGGSGTPSSNTLDSYEEGTWTPVLSRSTTAPSVTYTNQVGTYTKVGRMIYVSGQLSWTAISGGAGSFRVAGLPFTIINSVSAYPQMVSTDYSGVTFGANDTTFGGYGAVNGTHIVLLASKNNATGSTQISGLATSGFMYFSLTYHAA